MLTPTRTIQPFDPRHRLARDWAEWSVHILDLHGIDEVIDGSKRVVLIEVDADGEDWALSHALAHLELGHHQGAGAMSLDQEDQANWLARVWMN